MSRAAGAAFQVKELPISQELLPPSSVATRIRFLCGIFPLPESSRELAFRNVPRGTWVGETRPGISPRRHMCVQEKHGARPSKSAEVREASTPWLSKFRSIRWPKGLSPALASTKRIVTVCLWRDMVQDSEVSLGVRPRTGRKPGRCGVLGPQITRKVRLYKGSVATSGCASAAVQ